MLVTDKKQMQLLNLKDSLENIDLYLKDMQAALDMYRLHPDEGDRFNNAFSLFQRCLYTIEDDSPDAAMRRYLS